MIYDNNASEEDQAKYLFATGMLLVGRVKKRLNQLARTGATIEPDEGQLLCDMLYDIGSVIDVATVHYMCNEPTYSDGTSVVSIEQTANASTTPVPQKLGEGDMPCIAKLTGDFETIYEAVHQIASHPPGWKVVVADPPPEPKTDDNFPFDIDEDSLLDADPNG
ncbi:hypothetical protein [Mycobacterium sp. E2733]|uniref:hypothetical protein n=1 Tax=Mycobacterium sp. E2733 TaxID=1834138 RepID=UPI0007FC19B1|nr:hypothetical protein [Mycobacterium sp. E2733]OBH94300.1 hypothetical protein A5678_04545 [Mycobacterium sp. E2733]